MMYSVCRVRASAASAARQLVRRATSSVPRHSAAAVSSAPHSTLAAAAATASHSSLGSPLGAATSVAPVRAFTSTTATANAAAASDSNAADDGRRSAPAATAGSQGPTADTTTAETGAGRETMDTDGNIHASDSVRNVTATIDPPANILDVDPYPPERLAELEERYKWVDFNKMAEHLHMTDVHFFDQEVPYVDNDFTIKPDFRLLHRLDGANRLKRLQEQEEKKIRRLLHFGYWVTEGRNVRVATEGKIQSFWQMVIAGDMNGTASFGIGKGPDMGTAQTRAMQDLRRNMLFVPLFESRTLSHEIRGRHGVCQVRMWPRPRERGLTAGLIPRMVFECFGIQDITAKVNGRMLPHHQVLAIFDGLRQVKSLREEAIRRGVTAHRMFERGVQQPRHPTRAAMYARGQEVASMLREVRALQLHEDMLEDIGVPEALGKLAAERPSMADTPAIKRRFPAYPEWMEKGENADPGNVFIPNYVVRKPEPEVVAPHIPAPPHPQGRKPAIKETLFRYRGLPHPRTPQTEKTKKVMV